MDRVEAVKSNTVRTREILKQIREGVGEEYILGLRMSVVEFVDGGLTLEESCDPIKMFIDECFMPTEVPGMTCTVNENI